MMEMRGKKGGDILAIYHLSAQIIGRTSGRSAVTCASYRSGEKLHNLTTGETIDYTRKSGVIDNGIETPKDSPDWTKDREKLWSAVEEKENRKNSQFAREFNIALPSELTAEQNKQMVKDFCREQFTARGLVADWSIHEPNQKGDERNIHAHIMTTTRTINRDGWSTKDREGNDRNKLIEIRQAWEQHTNKELQKNGIDKRIDCRTLEAQGIDREPQQHMGEKATAVMRRGQEPDRKKYAEEIAKVPEQEKEKSEEVKKIEYKLLEVESLIQSCDDKDVLGKNLDRGIHNEKAMTGKVMKEALDTALKMYSEKTKREYDTQTKLAETLMKQKPAEPEKKTIFNGQKVEKQTAEYSQWNKKFQEVGKTISETAKTWELVSTPADKQDTKEINKFIDRTPDFRKLYEGALEAKKGTNEQFKDIKDYSKDIQEINEIHKTQDREKAQEKGITRDRDQGRSF